MQEVEQHEIQNLVNAVHARYLEDHSGEVATYIPELGKADPRHFGICLATVDGQVFDAGDTSQLFTIQSISKAFVFAMAIEEHGLEEVLRHVGVEPSGDAFNSIMLDEVTMRPFNPMVNAGAIATTALIGGATPEARFENLRRTFSRAAGRELERDDAVFESERLTGHRNRAIAHLMLNFGMIPDRVDEILDLYFSQCSLLVNAHDLALMGATLANLGINPVTGEHVFDVASVKYVLAVMLTCGMYDFSGEWAFRVGVPAKSGVAGGVLAVVNRQLGLGLYSPRLDSRGNSVRGFKACIEIADDLGLHAFDFLNVGSAFLQGMIKPD
jgi:glutaminase